jgi:glycine/D-amino acid oxidase-like deaminating enzyme
MRLTRREFFGLATAAAAFSGAAPPSSQDSRIPARFIGDAFERGHHWLTPDPEKLRVDHKHKARVVIVGGGIAGVVAAWRLLEAGIDDLVLLELEDKAGGLARSGMMGKTVVPFGGVMMAPTDGPVSPAVKKALELANVDRERVVWFPGYAALDIGSVAGSASRAVRGPDSRPFQEVFDSINVSDLLPAGESGAKAREFAARWCLGRFGARTADMSADAFWRDVGKRTRKTIQTLVIPGSGASLLSPMLARIGARFLPARVAVLVKSEPAGALVRAVDARDASVTDYAAEAVVLSVPPFIARKITPALRERDRDLPLPETTPWLVTAFQVSEWPLGVDSRTAIHQASDERAAMIVHAGAPPDAVIVTQRPFPATVANPARMFLRDLDPEDARDWSFRELENVFPGLRRITRSVDLWRVGHGSIRPAPGYATKIAPRIREPLGRIHPCGADYTGLPSIESAIEDGVRGAEGILKGFGKLDASWLR